jgi:thioester reductase-like protein
VSSSHPYRALRAVNVQGTREVLRLAFHSGRKPLHFVSTFNVFFAPEYARLPIIPEEDSLDHAAMPEGGAASGYAQTKWVAEKLASAARQRGLPATVYRFGRVSWASRSGIWNPDDPFRHIIETCLKLGAAPDLEMLLVLTPVDFIARALVALSLQPRSAGKAFHLMNPRPVALRQLAGWSGELGHPLDLLPYADWLTAARGAASAAALPHLADLRPPDPAAAAAGAADGVESEEAAVPRFDCRNAEEALAAAGIACPPIDAESLRAFLARAGGEIGALAEGARPAHD